MIAATNCLQAQAKFTLTPEQVIGGKSNVISNLVGFEGGWDRASEYNKVPNRKYNLLGVTSDYRDYFSNFEIEEIATKRKISYVRSNGEIVKRIQRIYISKGEKIIYFVFFIFDQYDNTREVGIFFDIQTGKELSGISNPNFFLNDKYTIEQIKMDSEVYNNMNRTYENVPGNGYVFDIEKNDKLFSFYGIFKWFSKDYSMLVTTKGIYSIADKMKLINTDKVIDGFSNDLKYAFIDNYLINVKLKSVIYAFDDFTKINSITNNKIKATYQDIQTHIYDLPRVELYAAYKNEIDAEFATLKPKDEFETQDQYNARNIKEKDFILTKYENLFLEKTNITKRKVADSYKQVVLEIDNLGSYIPEKQQFPITINGVTNLISIPLEDAKLFKPAYLSAKVTAIKQLDESGTYERVFNIKIANPNNGLLYNFGAQIKPLYVDDLSLAEVETGIPKLDIIAKLSEPSGNNLLDGNENATVDLIISNTGTGNARDIRINMKSETAANDISFDKSFYLSGLAAGKEQLVKLKINAARTIEDGEVNLNIETSEFKGFNPAPIILTFNTQKFQAPKLVFRDVSIKELAGNNNNIIENNEIIEANVLIQNIGQGISNATSASFEFGGDKNIVSTNSELTKQIIGSLMPGQDTIIKISFAVNNLYNGSDVLPINIILAESYKEYGGQFPLNLELKKVIQSAKNISIEGEYSKATVINEASLSSDVDKNIPTDTAVNNYKYALIIGNENYSKYQSGLKAESNVEFAINDAFVFKKYAENTLGVPEDHITYITDALSTKMKLELDKLVALSNIESLKNNIEIIFYYAGHGFPDKETEKGYLIPVDITGSSITNGVALSELYKKLSNENIKKASIFLDACFSGGGRNEGLAPGRGIMIKSKDEVIQNGNLVVFTASTGDQKSYTFKEKGHGMFTYYLLKKLQETKGDVSFDELAKYIKDNVEQNSLLKNNALQNPSILVSSQISEIWKNWSLKN